VGNDVMVK